MWHIIPQIQKDCPVDAKIVSWMPITDTKTNETKFFRIPPVVQILVAFDENDPVKLKFNKKGETWVIQSPDKMVQPTIKIGHRYVIDKLAQPKLEHGQKKIFSSKTVFVSKLKDRFGEDLAKQIVQLFDSAIAEIG